MKSIYASLILSSSLLAAESPDLQSLLQQGKFELAAETHAQIPSNKSTFTKAICQLTKSIEALQQGLYKYGFELNSSTAGIRSVSPVPHNPSPEIVDYQKIRTLLETFHEDLHAIEKTLTTIGEDPFQR